MKLEFITSSHVGHFSKAELLDLIIGKIKQNRILILEQELDADSTLELITRGLQEIEIDDRYRGLNMTQINIFQKDTGRFRSKISELNFHLITPANATIEKQEDGHYAISTDGELLASI